MRPDKKKTRHHDSMKCEAKAKQKAAENAKKVEKSQKQKTKQKEEDLKDVEEADDVVEAAVSTKEVAHINKDPKYAKRSVTSNWTKYELPSDDENPNEFGTGPEFQFVMEKSAQVADHLMLSSEKEWQREEEISNNNEHFALNLKNLETALDCMPIYQLLEVSKSEIDVSLFYY